MTDAVVVTGTTAVTDTADKVRFAQSSSLDTGSSPVWSAVAGTVADDGNGAVVTDTDAATTVVVGTVVSDDRTVIPAGSRNPDRRTATFTEARPSPANTVTDNATDDTAGDDRYTVDADATTVGTATDTVHR